MVVSYRRAGEVFYSISVPEVRDLLLAARQVLSGLVAVKGGELSTEPERP
jgi:ArsR family transcriptional regulator